MLIDGRNDFSLRIRSMERTDLVRVMELERVCFSDPWPRSAFDSVFEDEGWHGAVGEIDTGIIAYGCWLTTAGEAHLANIAVAPEHRRKSCARQILDYILEQVSIAGCRLILLEVRPSNEAACRFYEQAGFSVLYERPRYYQRPTESALVMAKALAETEHEEER